MVDHRTLRDTADDTKMENAAVPQFSVETGNGEDTWQSTITRADNTDVVAYVVRNSEHSTARKHLQP